MVIRDLVALYERLSQDPDSGIPPYGYSNEKVAYEIVIDREGDVQDIVPLESPEGRRMRPWIRAIVPEHTGRGSAIVPYFLCDKGSYLFGLDQKRGDRLFEASRALHEAILEDITGPEADAIRAFFSRPDRADEFTDEMVEELSGSAMCAFRLIDAPVGSWLHDAPAMRAAWDAYRARPQKGTPRGICSITGREDTLARLVPMVRGVPGAQPSGAGLVSVNFEAAESYGRTQAYNAQIGEYAAFASSTALQRLIDDPAHRVMLGNMLVLFWSPGATDEEDALMRAVVGARPFEDDEACAALWNQLVSMASGRPRPEAIDPDRPYTVLGIVPNASRLSVHMHYHDTLAGFMDGFVRYLDESAIEGADPVTVRQLLLQTAPQGEAAGVSQSLIDATMRAVLQGGPWPPALGRLLIMRMRADRGQAHPWDMRQRAALFRALLVRGTTNGEERYTMGLNRNNDNVGYLLGRLFAIFERAQRAAVRPKATIADRYMASASATPAHVFPALMRTYRAHLQKLSRVAPGLKVILDRDATSILADGLGSSIPATLSSTDQMSFYIGYYQQREELWKKREEDADDEPSEE